MSSDHPAIFLYNSLGRKKEEFHPLHPGEARLYVCGITPYDEPHLGHARCYVAFDAIRRHLARRGYKVTFVQNVTDVDDKIIARATERGVMPAEIATRYTASFTQAMDALGVMWPDQSPKATEAVPAMVEAVAKLVEKGFAYAVGGDVFFRVRRVEDYGRLSGRKPDDMISGARVEVDERKEDPLDFALWKAAKPGEPSWDSPWGPGRPGWHLECSVMSAGALGQPFDIHGGGGDLLFPHHENELAQSWGLAGTPLARYWLHNGFVTLDREKMAKSVGNVVPLPDLLRKVPPHAVRYFLLTQQYRGPLDYSEQRLSEAVKAWEGIVSALEIADEKVRVMERDGVVGTIRGLTEMLMEARARFTRAMDNDFNTAAALAVIHELVHLFHTSGTPVIVAQVIRELGAYLGLEFQRDRGGLEFFIQAMIDQREEARKRRDWAEADRLRNLLGENGILVEDTPHGPRWGRRSN